MPGLGVCTSVVLIEGAEGNENRVLDAAGDKCSPEDSEAAESTENRGCG